MKRTIPHYIIDPKIRLEIAETIQHLEVLERNHQKLIKRLKAEGLDSEQKKLLAEVSKAHINLSKKYRALAPTLIDVAVSAINKSKGKIS